MIQQLIITENTVNGNAGLHFLPETGLPLMPENEIERNEYLSELHPDYAGMPDLMKDLANAAAKITGASVAFISLIDSFNQWMIGRHGYSIEQIDREESVCQYTILGNHPFEVKDLGADKRFADISFVKNDPFLTYYWGIPLTTSGKYNIGSLAIMHSSVLAIDPAKTEMLRILADEVVVRLKNMHEIRKLRMKIKEAEETRKRLAHDIRGPLGGIISLADIISRETAQRRTEDVEEFGNLIMKSGLSLLELADEILHVDHKGIIQNAEHQNHEFTLSVFKEKILKLYTPLALHKKIDLQVNIKDSDDKIPFAKTKLLQITGNLISNAIKFTPSNGKVVIDLHMALSRTGNKLNILVKDTGIGLNEESIRHIQDGHIISQNGTNGEHGYGYGLALVKELVEGLHGSMDIISKPGEGAVFEIRIPQS